MRHLIILAVLLLPLPAAAQLAGNWLVKGAISGNAFVLNCRFQPNATGFGGICVETPSGKTHTLTAGSVKGAKITWSYPAHYMFLSFAVNFTGTLAGNSITGTTAASGRSGNFTATRQ